MAGKEGQPGFIEKASYIGRNIDVAVAGIALYFGHLGVAAIAAMAAIIEHNISKNMENKRLRPA